MFENEVCPATSSLKKKNYSLRGHKTFNDRNAIIYIPND
jgi:hypothetical protein